MKSLTTIIICFFFSNVAVAQTWSAVGNGVNGRVSSFAIYNNELYVSGQFELPGIPYAIGLFKWNGVTFDTLPGNYLFGDCRIEAMTVYNNELYLGGGFTTFNSAYPSIYDYMAKWNGSSFSAVGSGCDNVVYSLEAYNGNLYVGGDMTVAGGAYSPGIVKWNGSQWSDVGNGITGSSARVFRLAVYDNELYASGGFYFDVLNTNNIAKWNDSIWSEVGPGGIPGVVYALGTYNNELYAGGPYFTTAGGIPVNQIARWNGTTWADVGGGIGLNVAHIFALKEYQNELYTGGTFNIMDGDSLKSIARYNGNAWNSVGSGVDSCNVIVDTIFGMPEYAPHTISAFIEFNNELYAGGHFNMIGGVTAHSVAKWSIPVGIEENHSMNTIAVFPNPALEQVTIRCDELYNFYELYDLSGKLMMKGNISSRNFELDLHFLESGIYILSVNNNQKHLHKKVLKQN